MNSIATGIYLAVSIVDHNCVPNAVATFEKRKLYIRLLEDIPSFDWSKVFISYIDLINTRDDRRKELKAQYYFLCTCSRCVGKLKVIDLNLKQNKKRKFCFSFFRFPRSSTNACFLLSK